MVRLKDLILCPLALAGAASVSSRQSQRDVRATLADGSTVIGYDAEGLSTWQGIPFAQPPVGPLRLRPPQALNKSLGTFDATQVAQACPQLALNLNSSNALISIAASLVNTPFGQDQLLNAGEDCLTLNVIAPPDAKPGDNLPVVFWMFGGAFAVGWSSLFNGSTYVQDSITAGKPIVWVAVNYRVGGFGFMGGKEMLAEGSTNLGLRDQRMGLQWVADNIAQFGGNPDHVVLYGESAGAVSVSLQMSYNGGNNLYKDKPLFHGGIMDSGSIIPYAPYDSPQAQSAFDQTLAVSGCSDLACLRSLSYTDFLNAATSVPTIFEYAGVQLTYAPRPDGDVIPQTVDVLSQTGQYAKIPFIIGDQNDEGTLFSLVQTNLSTTADFVTYLNQYFFPQASRDVVEGYAANYPDDAWEGSPYGTGPLYNLYPQRKRVAALLGDQLFTLQRRRTLHYNLLNSGGPAWTYLATYLSAVPELGTFHASDILHGFGSLGDTDAKKVQHAYYLSFFNTLDPNNGTSSEFSSWPQWTENGREMLSLTNSIESDVGNDTFREASYQYLLKNSESLRT